MSRVVLDEVKRQITASLRAAEPKMRSTARKRLIRTIGHLADAGDLTEREAQLAIIHLAATNAWHEIQDARKKRRGTP
jgi:hypothetical protein